MITSRLMLCTLLATLSSLALPSGLSTALSKSKKASAAKVTLEAAATGAAGAATGAAGAAWAAFCRAPSQPSAAVAGVQLASRQHSSLVPFFQTNSLVPFFQLSTVCAPAAVARAAPANKIATLLSFFMILLFGIKPLYAKFVDVISDHHQERCLRLCHRVLFATGFQERECYAQPTFLKMCGQPATVHSL